MIRGDQEGGVRHDVGDTTEELPRIVTARRTLHVGLAGFAVTLFGLAGALVAAAPRGQQVVAPDATAAIDAEAQRLAMILDTTTKSVRVQAETMTGGPQIRAGVMTDAATVKDLVTSELQLPRNLDQTLEVVQLRDHQRTVLMTLPAGSPPIHAQPGHDTRFEIDGRKQLAVVAVAPIAPYDPSSGITGELVLSTPLDFTLTRENLAAHAASIALTGEGWTFSIAQGQDAAGAAIQRPLVLSPAWKIEPLVLEVTPRLTATTAGWVAPVKFGAAGLGLALALVLGLSLYRNRDP